MVGIFYCFGDFCRLDLYVCGIWCNGYNNFFKGIINNFMKIRDLIQEAANPAQQAAIALSMKKAGKRPKNEATKETGPKFTGYFKGKDKPPVGKRMVGGESVEEEKKSLRNTNPCWKGYHPVGTKKKNGRTVPNCVPESVNVGDQVRTQDMRRRGVVESVELYRPFGEKAVYFRTADNQLLRTPISNIVKIPQE
jgi:hypothetical protein